jgi:hypothetical protein
VVQGLQRQLTVLPRHLQELLLVVQVDSLAPAARSLAVVGEEILFMVAVAPPAALLRIPLHPVEVPVRLPPVTPGQPDPELQVVQVGPAILGPQMAVLMVEEVEEVYQMATLLHVLPEVVVQEAVVLVEQVAAVVELAIMVQVAAVLVDLPQVLLQLVNAVEMAFPV